MDGNRQDVLGYYGYKSINEMISSECTPLLDIVLKLSSIASNFANAANSVKNINMNETHQVEELLEITFNARRLAEKVEKVAEDRIELHLEIIKSGLFDKIKVDEVKEKAIEETLVLGTVIKKGLNKNGKE